MAGFECGQSQAFLLPFSWYALMLVLTKKVNFGISQACNIWRAWLTLTPV